MNNPFVEKGADPWIVDGEDGYYYYMCTKRDYLEIMRMSVPGRIEDSRIIWRTPESGPYSEEIWAPELHRVNGKWVVYFAASDGTHDAGRGMHVLECIDEDPMRGEWAYAGAIHTERPGLDGTILRRGDEMYFIYAGYGDFNGHGSALYLARMTDYRTIGSKEVCLTIPEYEWERQGGMPINEGPAILHRNGRFFVVYSASTTWSEDYALGMLTISEDADLLDPANWKKEPSPVFRKNVEENILAPGHNCFIRYKNQDYIVYHAIDGKSGQGNLDPQKRSPRIQPFRWKDDGTPDFGVPTKRYTFT